MCTENTVQDVAEQRAAFWQYPPRGPWTVSLRLMKVRGEVEAIEVTRYADGRTEVISLETSKRSHLYSALGRAR
jgi:hypothetical protein